MTLEKVKALVKAEVHVQSFAPLVVGDGSAVLALDLCNKK
jgi:hypothetical protein